MDLKSLQIEAVKDCFLVVGRGNPRPFFVPIRFCSGTLVSTVVRAGGGLYRVLD